MRNQILDIMNRTVFALREDESVGTAIDYFLALGLTSAPVIDLDANPVGVVGWRDLLVSTPESPVAQCMVSPVHTLSASAEVGEAAALMDEYRVHHVVIIDARGAISGFVSSLDVVRGLTGRTRKHPDFLPHFNGSSYVVWPSEGQLSTDALATVDELPGMVTVFYGDRSKADGRMWSEAVSNMRVRLDQILSRSIGLPASLRELPANAQLHFRAVRFGPTRIVGPALGTSPIGGRDGSGD